jgi:hypothetical protein
LLLLIYHIKVVLRIALPHFYLPCFARKDNYKAVCVAPHKRELSSTLLARLLELCSALITATSFEKVFLDIVQPIDFILSNRHYFGCDFGCCFARWQNRKRGDSKNSPFHPLHVHWHQIWSGALLKGV